MIHTTTRSYLSVVRSSHHQRRRTPVETQKFPAPPVWRYCGVGRGGGYYLLFVILLLLLRRRWWWFCCYPDYYVQSSARHCWSMLVRPSLVWSIIPLSSFTVGIRFPTTKRWSVSVSTTSIRPPYRNLGSSLVVSMSESKMSSTMAAPKRSIVVDPFCHRQFREYYQHDDNETIKDYTGTIFDVSISEFERIVNERFHSSDGDLLLQDGYAPFCKHLFLRNDFTDAVVNVLPITDDNEHLLRTKYLARNDKELPVLTRYFPKELIAASTNQSSSLPIAKYLDLILYSREQINLENQATQTSTTIHDADSTTTTTETAPWGIVSIKAQDLDTELPMTPITNMRNALGKEHGGSGIPLDRDKYMECVNYWKDHATIS